MFTKTDQHISSRNKALFNQENPSSFIQPKLNVGQPGDKYEVEADRAADNIVAKSNSDTTSFISPNLGIQKQSDEDIQQKPVVDEITPGVQLKENSFLQKSQEEEIQQKEEEVQEKSEEETVQTQLDENVQESKDTLQTKTIEVTPIQNKSAEEEVQTKEEEIQEKEDEETLQQKSTGAGDASGIEDSLSSSKGGGSPLDSETKGEMEAGFGSDFSGVRVHNDSNAVQMNQELGSQAFTNGNDIYLNEGKYNPSSDSGKHLLAHELTHTVQQGASPAHSIQQKEAKTTKREDGKPTVPLDITQRFGLNDAWATYLDGLYAKGKRIFEVDVKIGNRYGGTIKVTKKTSTITGKKAKYELYQKGFARYLNVSGWSFMDPLRNAGVEPILVLKNFGDDQITKGFLSIKTKGTPLIGDAMGFMKGFNSNLEKMKMHGISTINVNADGLKNTFEQGKLNFQVNALSTKIAGFMQAGGGIGIVNDGFTINFVGKIDVPGVATGELNIKRKQDGNLDGSVEIDANISNVNAKVKAEYVKGEILIQGSGRIQSEKFSGELNFLVTDEAKSKQMMHAALGVQTLEGDKKQAKAPKPSKKKVKTQKNLVIVGWGTVEVTITPWLQGKATVGLDHKGQVTVIGSISVPNEVRLMEQKGKKQDLFDVEIKAGYGIPLVGQVFLFAGVGMFVNAGFGPLVLKDVGFTGTYSTDPSVLQNFNITGTLNINAFAMLGLKIEAGVGVTLLGHDIKAGISGTAAAGIQAYAEATPTFEYKEKKNPTGGKVGESRLKGHFEAAAQVFLQLGGSLFYELDSPWWSPAPDGRTDHPLGEVQYPLDQMGIGADVDWLVGSEKPPELKFKPVKFDPGKFTADMMADPPKKKQGESKAKPKGKFDDKSGGGNKQKNPKLEKGGKGNPNTKKKDPKKLSDDQKYLQGLNELSKLEKANPKPSIGVVKTKMQQVKSKYGLQTVNIKTQKDGEVTIYVKHKKQNNSKRLLKIKMMSSAERMKLLTAAMGDLRKREMKILDKQGNTLEAKAKDMLNTWKKAHPVIESAKVVDGKTTWDYEIDTGEKKGIEKGKGKTGKELGKSGAITATEDFKDKSNKKHRLFVSIKNGKRVVFMASEPKSLLGILEGLLDNETDDTKKDKIKEAIRLTKELNKYIKKHEDSINSGDKQTETINNDIDAELKKIKDEVKELIQEGDLPLTKVTYSMSGNKPDRVTAYPLTKLPGNTKGTIPTEDPEGWGLVRTFDYAQYYIKDRKYIKIEDGKEEEIKKNFKVIARPKDWIRFHLLNNEGMHGPGLKWNLVPSHFMDNVKGGYLSQIEEPVKKKMDQDKSGVFYFNVKVVSHRDPSDIDTKKVKDNIEKNELDFEKIKKDYQSFPLELEVNAGKLKMKSDGTYEEDDKNKIHTAQPFKFTKNIDLTIEPGKHKTTIIEQGEGNNKSLGVPLVAARVLGDLRNNMVANMDEFIREFGNNGRVKTWKTKIAYLKKIISILEGNPMEITLLSGGSATTEISGLKLGIEEYETNIRKEIFEKFVEDEVKEFLKEKGKPTTQAAIAIALERSGSSISNYLRGNTRVTEKTLNELKANFETFKSSFTS